MKITLVLLTLLVSGVAFAAGGSGPSSLIPPAINVLLLLSLLVYFLRKPAKNFFQSKSETVSEMLERASSKAKEAQAMMDAQMQKAKNAEGEIQKLEKENEQLIAQFMEEYKKDVEQRIVKMKEDAGQKIEAEKKEMLNELNSNLLDLVISKTKQEIRSSNDLTQNAAKNMVKGL